MYIQGNLDGIQRLSQRLLLQLLDSHLAWEFVSPSFVRSGAYGWLVSGAVELESPGGCCRASVASCKSGFPPWLFGVL